MDDLVKQILIVLHILPGTLMSIVCQYAKSTGYERLTKLLKSNHNALYIRNPQNHDFFNVIYDDNKNVVLQTRKSGLLGQNTAMPITKLIRILENKSWPTNADDLWTILHTKWIGFVDMELTEN